MVLCNGFQPLYKWCLKHLIDSSLPCFYFGAGNEARVSYSVTEKISSPSSSFFLPIKSGGQATVKIVPFRDQEGDYGGNVRYSCVKWINGTCQHYSTNVRRKDKGE
jgi:hypothetical protein